MMRRLYGLGVACLLLACSGNGSGGASGNGGSGAAAGSVAGAGGTGGGGACDTLGSKCHGVEGDAAKECHELGHNGDEAKCQEKLADCLKVCVAGSGGTGGIGGAGGQAGTTGGAAGAGGAQGGMGGNTTGGTGAAAGAGGSGANGGNGANGGASGAGSGGAAGSSAGAGGAGGSTGGSGAMGGTGGSGGGDSQACRDYCTCMDDTCRDQTGYPFATPAECLGACQGYQPDELTCWSKWCEDAKTSSSKLHLCEHAWGAFALDEC